MHASTLQGFLGHLRRLTDPARSRELSDADLLERFRLHREEAAFTLLVQRHGPMVLNVCRRILGDVHEAEDAFQATFLVLVRKAGTIRQQHSLAGWLHRVAAHIAHKAGMQLARRQTCQREIVPPTRQEDCFDTLAAAELRAALDEEIERLPAKYRTPLVLCYLADKTHAQAAVELGWPKSSVTARLAKARELLQRRLTRRGFIAPAGLLAMLLTETTANAMVPSLLTLSTVRLAVQALTGETLTATSAAVLAGSFVKGTTALKLTVTLVLLATLGFAAIGYRMAAPGSSSQKQEGTPKAQAAGERREAKLEPRKPRVDLLGDALPDEAVARMGSGRLRHPGGGYLLAFSPDGKSIVSGGSRDLRIWNTATGTLLRRFDFAETERLTSFQFTGLRLICAVHDHKGIVTIQIMDPATGQVRRRLSLKEPAKVRNPTVSPNGKRLAVAQQNDIRLYDSTSGEMVLRIPVKGVAAWDMAFTPDSKTLAFNDLSSGTVYLHEAATGKLVRELKRPSDTTLHLVFSPDGRFLASMPQGRPDKRKGEVSIWNVREGKEIQRWTHPFALAVSAAFSADGKYAAIGGGRWGLVLWDVETGKKVRRLSPHGGVYGIAFSPDGKTLATASPRGAIRLWDAATGTILPASSDRDIQFVDRLRFSADGKRLFGDAGACLIWEPSTGREVRRIADPEEFDFKLANDMRCLALSPDGSLLAAANPDRTIGLWDAATGKKKQLLKGHKGAVWNLVFAPDTRKVISNGSDELVRVWDTASGRELHQLHGQTPLAVSPDSRHLATAEAKTANVFVYDLATGRETKRFALAAQGNVFQLAFSADNRFLAAAGSPHHSSVTGIVKVWDVAGGQLVCSLESPKTVLWSAAFSPDGRSVATGDSFGAVVLWELASGKPRHAFVGHKSQIKSIAFSPRGRCLAVSSVDAPVFVWDVAGTLEAKQRRLSNDELRRGWSDLANEDAAVAFQALRRLCAVPEQTLPLLRERLKPVAPPDPKRVRQLVAMLDSDDFPTRQQASEELAKRADAASGLLRQIMSKEKPSLEVRQRLRAILDVQQNKPESLRTVRAVEVLEWIATPEAVRLLDELVKGAADARLTCEAVAARNRLRK
jgi:RNA polymerase sigma factor (sigma-70 family)